MKPVFDIVEIINDNYKAPFYIRSGTSDVKFYKEIITNAKQEYNFLVKKEPEVIIDAGANIGLASVFFTNKYPNAKIIAIEPEDSNFKMLEINTKPYSNIHIIKAALWDSVCEINLFNVGLGTGGFMVGTENKTNDFTIPYIEKLSLTKTVTIEYIMQEYGIDKIDILKIDIEGAEREVFNSSSAWIDKVNLIIVELHERMKKGCNEAFSKIIEKFDNSIQNGEDSYLYKDNYIEMYKSTPEN